MIDCLEVYWPCDGQYFLGTVSDINAARRHIINNDDGDIENLNISNETRHECTNMAGNSVQTHRFSSDALKVTKDICVPFGNKPYFTTSASISILRIALCI